jgi:hypothetical protein
MIRTDFSPGKPRLACSRIVPFFTLFYLLLAVGALRADEVQMQNGDRYLGQVLSLNTNSLVLQSDMLGTVRLPRGKVAFIALGSSADFARRVSAIKNASPPSRPALTNAPADWSKLMRQAAANRNLLQQVRNQFLAGADPTASRKFDELLAGLMSGQLNLSDLRKEAQTAADQIKTLKRDLGDESEGTLDGYLSILEDFLNETAPGQTTTNAPVKAPSSIHGR